MATKIRLKRMGKKFYAFYRVVITDSRNKRDGKSIEEIGIYDPNKQPSLIQIDSERAQYWLGVGAQPSEPVLNLLKITGDWQKFKGLPGAEGTLKTPEIGPDAAARVEAAEAQAQKLKAAQSEAKAKEAAAQAAEKAAAEDKAEVKADAEAENREQADAAQSEADKAAEQEKAD
ncbi:30S ribosomal protein S16 [Bifidobacterium aemilianum]|uniref:Small ribosomal subunit protein bS16 n=1 Tax=Bifidobacterium aemilianum TaxID=2493120 RepID=A0A366K6N6_9BIFI|nr:30S ribosomal protein S16 [Bifidobacterium aemilianum]RBP97410.1 30S ribosomal protein S16 [Bifidobacterium aemilianum]